MSAFSPLLTRFKSSATRSPNRGWIGVDIGTRQIKLAQIQRQAGEYQLTGCWTIGSDDDQPLDRQTLRDSGLAHRRALIHSARAMFHGRDAAATLPMSFVELRSLELPSGPRQELLAMVEQELAGDLEGNEARCDIDAWEAGAVGDTSKVVAVACEHNLGMKVARDLLSAGLQCNVLDAVPCAMARAVQFCDPAVADRAACALDLGEAAAMVTVIHGTLPVFCRMLRGCGLQAIVQRLRDKLHISRPECRQLLTRYGLPDAAGNESALATHRIIAPVVEQLVEELRRTLQFIGQQSPQMMPQRLWLFGGGALIRNLPEYLAARLEMPTSRWSLAPPGCPAPENADALYGVAAGLSALAWEAS